MPAKGRKRSTPLTSIFAIGARSSLAAREGVRVAGAASEFTVSRALA